jgi:hypothetical protein
MSYSTYDAMMVIWLCLFCFVLSLLNSCSLCRLVLYCVNCAAISYLMDCLMICLVIVRSR